MSTSITLLLPVKNEIDGLRAMVPRIDTSLFTQVLIVDGWSVDGSFEFAQQHPNLEVIRQPAKAGLAEAIISAHPFIKGDMVITFSPDGNSLPEVLPQMVSKMCEGYDLVVASRYLPPAKSADDTLVTAFGNALFTTVIRGLGRQKITDALNIYRGYRKSILVDSKLRSFIWGPVLEPLLTAYALIHKYKITEIPGDEPPRIGGERKMRIFYNGFAILVMILRMYIYRLKRMFSVAS